MVRQVSVCRPSKSPLAQSDLCSTTDAAPLTAFPTPALQEERVIELEGVGDAEVHGHVLDVLGPVCGMGSQLLHLRTSLESRKEGLTVKSSFDGVSDSLCVFRPSPQRASSLTALAASCRSW